MTAHTPRKVTLDEAPELAGGYLPPWMDPADAGDQAYDTAAPVGKVSAPVAPVRPLPTAAPTVSVEAEAPPAPVVTPTALPVEEQAPRMLAVVAPDSLYTPLSYLPVPWRLQHFATVKDLLDALTLGHVTPDSLDGVILAEGRAGTTIEEALRNAGSLIANRIPTALVTYTDGARETVAAQWPAIEGRIQAHHDTSVVARQKAGEALTYEELTSPLDSTVFAVVPASGGAQYLVRCFGPVLRHPFTADDIAGITDARYATAFPNEGRTQVAADDLAHAQGRIITITSSKGGSGKTSLSVMLASTIAYTTRKAGKPLRVVVVDADKQSQLAHLFPKGAGKSLANLKVNSTAQEVQANLFVPEPQHLPNLAVLRGGATNSEHGAIRTEPLYAHVLTVLTEDLADVVIVDGSVDIIHDPVMEWIERHSDDVCYILDTLSNSLEMAVQAQQILVDTPVEDGGLGLDPRRFHLIINKAIAHTDIYGQFITRLNQELPHTDVLAVIGNLGSAVDEQLTTGQALRFAVEEPAVAEPLRQWAYTLLNEKVYDAPTRDEGKKRRWFK